MALNSSFVSFDGGIQQLKDKDTSVIVPAILSTISGLGIGGNVLVLVVLIYVFTSRRASEANVMLANLSASDLLILSLCAPVRAVTYYRRTWTLGLMACRTTEWIQHSCLAVKSFTLLATSQARHNFSSGPDNPSNFQQKRVLMTVVIIWTVALVFPIPDIVFSRLKEERNISLCVSELPSYSHDVMHVFSKILPLGIYVLPIILSVVCHIRAIFHIKPITHVETFLPRQYECSLLYLSVIAMNALMMLPEWASWVWMRHSSGESCKPSAGLLIFAQVCVYLSSAFFPAILLTMHVPLRESLSDLCSLLACRGGKNRQKTEGNGNEMRTMAMKVLDERGCVPTLTITERHSDASCQTFPDLEHFWSERRNTTVAEDSDPLPWERLNQSTVEL
ncbi:G-protein coupled receptor 151 protein-like [Myxocyprinus asiaticus]|uniref:G-protein coupled receptor 151 protein-like n=1 Tax=Myxocyprinus asiaticus TaxID=70543 RepID=UPI002222359D|nr:G-protein coupled receptor 151 protein-like [Myxocyprinus asiaticus]